MRNHKSKIILGIIAVIMLFAMGSFTGFPKVDAINSQTRINLHSYRNFFEKLRDKREKPMSAEEIKENQEKKKGDQILSYLENNKDKPPIKEELKRKLPKELKNRTAIIRKRNQSIDEILNKAIEEGIISSDDAKALKELFLNNKKEVIENALDNLVREGTITKEQSQKIMQSIEKSLSEKKAEFEKISKMNEAQRTEYFKTRPKYESPITKLVNEGVITNEQAEKIINEFTKARK